MSPRARPVVLAATSGTGKTTLAHRLVEGPGRYTFSVSATTRRPRPGERDGVDYHFVDEAGFRAMVAAGDFAEWAQVHGRLYGTPRAELDRAAERGRHVVLDIDVQGAMQIRVSVPDAVLIFVLPPSVETLLDRLTGRGTEANEEVARRLRSALDELRAAPDFDHLVVNDELDRCLAEIRGIVEGDGGAGDQAAPRRQVEELRREIARLLEDRFANATG